MSELAQRWWKQETDAHRFLLQDLLSLHKFQTDRCGVYGRFLSMFMGHTDGRFPAGQPSSLPAIYKQAMDTEKGALILNATENCASALAARIASQRPRAEFMTDSSDAEGAFDLRFRAKGMSKFVQGCWQTERVYRKAPVCFLDGAVFGLGALKVYGSQGKVNYERTPPWELVIDERAAMSCAPRVMHQVMQVPAEVLMANFPKHKTAIGDAAGKGTSLVNLAEGEVLTTDLVEVVEAWHLPSSDEAGDGRHMIAIDGDTLLYEEYKKPRFPFAFFFWSTPLHGWYPQGMVEQQESAQLFVNKMLTRFQEALHIGAALRLLYEKGALDPAKVTNLTGSMVECDPGALSGGRIKFEMPGTLAADAYKFVWEVYAKIFEGTGVSQLSAAGVKPPGIEAAVALRALEEKEAGRHALTNLFYEDFFLDAAELTIDVARDLAADGSLKSKYRENRGGLEIVEWEDVDMDRDMFEIQVFPTSLLPYTPSGRLATVEEMLNAGFIDRTQALHLLDAPDLEQFASLETASLDDIDKQLSLMLAKGEAQLPEVYQDLELAISRATSSLIRARHQGAPPARQKLVLDYIEKAVKYKTTAQPVPPAPAPMPMPGGEMPMPPPGPQADVPLATPEEPMP